MQRWATWKDTLLATWYNSSPILQSCDRHFGIVVVFVHSYIANNFLKADSSPEIETNDLVSLLECVISSVQSTTDIVCQCHTSANLQTQHICNLCHNTLVISALHFQFPVLDCLYMFTDTLQFIYWYKVHLVGLCM